MPQPIVDKQGVKRYLVTLKVNGDDHTLVVNPLYTRGFAEDLRLALDMPLEERRTRMAALKTELAGNTIYDWMEDFLDASGESRARALASAG